MNAERRPSTAAAAALTPATKSLTTIVPTGDTVADDALFDLHVSSHDGIRTTTFTAARLRAEGMAAAVEHADGWWRQTIEDAIRHFAETGEMFMSDDVVELLPEPPAEASPNLIGALFAAAASTGLIEHRGYRKSVRPSARRRPVSVWVGKAATVFTGVHR